jgi:hypothetical protein
MVAPCAPSDAPVVPVLLRVARAGGWRLANLSRRILKVFLDSSQIHRRFISEPFDTTHEF